MGQLSGYMALQELLAGNRRYMQEQSRHPDGSAYHREMISKDQRPSVVVVGCSDSRVTPSVIFDQGLGFMFEIRTAGHIVDDVGMGSIEFAVAHLGTQLVLVLGHTGCGAVTLAMTGGEVEGKQAAVAKVLSGLPADVGDGVEDPIGAAVEINVHNVVEHLVEDGPVISRLVAENRLMVVGAVYDIVTGEVAVIETIE